MKKLMMMTLMMCLMIVVVSCSDAPNEENLQSAENIKVEEQWKLPGYLENTQIFMPKVYTQKTNLKDTLNVNITVSDKLNHLGFYTDIKILKGLITNANIWASCCKMEKNL